MLSVIKTAIITIIISFISGVLLDAYKNFAPKIKCTLKKGALKNMNDKSYREYNLTVRNVSRKTLHDLNINIQDDLESIVVKDTRIKKGLRFNLNKEYNEYNIAVPFLSKNDEFIATILIEETKENKPYVALRSPEEFKQTYKEIKRKQKASSQSSFNSNSYKNDDIDKTTSLDRSELIKANSHQKCHSTKDIKTFISKKVIFAVIGILVIIYVGILGVEKINGSSMKTDTIDKAVSTQKQQNSTENSSVSSSEDNKNKINKQGQAEEKIKSKSNTSKDKGTSSAVEDNTTKETSKVVKENNTTEASKENENTNANNNDGTATNTAANSNNSTNNEEKQSIIKSSENERSNISKNESNSKDQNSNVKNNADSKSMDTTNKIQ